MRNWKGTRHGPSISGPKGEWVTISGGRSIFNSLQWKIALVYTLLLLFTLQLISVYLVQSLERYYLYNYKAGLETQAELLAHFLIPRLRDGLDSDEDIAHLVREFGGVLDMELVVLDRHARVIGASGDPSPVGRRLIREEITRALAGQAGEAVRYDPVADERRYFLALPLLVDGAGMGVIYLSGSLKNVDDILNEIKLILLTGAAAALCISCLLGIVLAGTITSPLRKVTAQASSMARGDFSRQIQVETADEIGQLGKTFNYLARQLSHTIRAISSEKSKIEAIIKNMSDGVLALDGKGKLIQINPAARKLLQTLQMNIPALGRSGFRLLKDLIGAEALRLFIKQQQPLTVEITREKPFCVLQVKLAPFEEEAGRLKGTLLVLHDVTGERELQRRQQEFVADVSHELRTPLATVKSYIETLLDGAAEEPAVRHRFLRVVEGETERMVSLVKDLLALSHLDYQRVEWHKTAVAVGELALEAVEQCRQKVGLEPPRITVEIPEKIPPVLVDRSKVMQVFQNLLHNAVRHTPPEGEIHIRAYAAGDMVKILIEDSGVGIPEEELSRVFERFYRVEKNRSRDYGGTGLGLPIARKVVEAHGGSIWLESAPGKGTRAWFTLPRAPGGEATAG